MMSDYKNENDKKGHRSRNWILGFIGVGLVAVIVFLMFRNEKYEVDELEDAHQLMEKVFKKLSSEPYYTDPEGHAEGTSEYDDNFLRNLQLRAPTSSAVLSSADDNSISVVKHMSNLLLNEIIAKQVPPPAAIDDTTHPQLPTNPLFTLEDIGHRWGYRDYPVVKANGEPSEEIVQEFMLRFIQTIYNSLVSAGDKAKVSPWQLANAFYEQRYDDVLRVFKQAHQDGYHERSVNEGIAALVAASAAG